MDVNGEKVKVSRKGEEKCAFSVKQFCAPT